ncbi:MAG: S-layer homology domain-containing protein [Bryobacteraceae bacterium]
MGYLLPLLLAGLALTVPAYSQLDSCSLTLTPQNIAAAPGASTGSIAVTTGPGCAWVALGSNSAWIQQTSSSAAVTGSGTIAYGVAANTDPTPRSGTLTVILLGGVSVSLQVQILQEGTIIAQPFIDVPTDSPVVDYVNQIRIAGLTNGCSLFPPQYCPDQNVSRGQMAAFIIRAVMGSDNFVYPNLPYFDDVQQNHPYFKYIQKLRELAITSGCSAVPALYCPDTELSRLQMAIFLMRGKFGSVAANAGLGNSANPYFTDVGAGSAEFPFIQKMKDFGITSGCTATQYCPASAVTRAQTAVFLARLFLTPYIVF